MDTSVLQTELDRTPPHPTEQPSSGRRRLRLVCHGATHPGQVRPVNEDQFLIAALAKALQVLQTSLPDQEVQYSGPHGHMLLVADGVGGHAGGRYASALAVSAVEDFVLDTLNWCLRLRYAKGSASGAGNLLAEFRKALEQADRRLFEEARLRPDLRGMGTTMTLAFCLDSDLFLAHVGDSRAYLLRDGLLHRLTSDHTLVQELVQRGALAPEEAEGHALRHVITNVVGGSEPGVNVEVHKLGLEPGDRLLLCSDGLTEMVPDGEILRALQADDDPAEVCRKLIDLANANGGRDNVTVVVARLEA
jgi:protein phosphatase